MKETVDDIAWIAMSRRLCRLRTINSLRYNGAVGTLRELDRTAEARKCVSRNGPPKRSPSSMSTSAQGHRASAPQPGRLLLNMVDVAYMNSACIGKSISLFLTAENWPGKLKLVNLTERMRKLFEITRQVKTFEMFDTEVEVLKSF
jgi:anti-anti-sigma factor